MKRAIVFGFALAAFLVSGTFSEALAQRGPRDGDGRRGPEQRIERHLQMLDNRLELSDEQEQQIRTLLEAHAAEMRQRRADNDDATREQRSARVRESMEALRGEISGVLTAAQSAKMEEMHKRMQQRWQGERGEHGRHMRGHMGRRMGGDADQGERRSMRGAFLQDLELTDAQQEQLQSLRESHRAEMQAWREANADASREERRTWMRERAEQHRAAMMSILNDEQKEQLETLRSEWREKMQDRREERGEGRKQWRQHRDRDAQ